MKTLLTCSAVCATLLFDTSTAEAQNDPDTLVFPDVIACMLANEELDRRYRSWMQLQCVEIATYICLTIDDRSGACMQTHVATMRSYYDQLMPLIPSEIDENPLLARNYQRRVERVRDAFDATSDCRDLSGYDYIECEGITLGVALVDLFPLARRANVELP